MVVDRLTTPWSLPALAAQPKATSAREKMAPPWATPMPFLWFSVMGMVTRAYSRLTSSMHISR